MQKVPLHLDANTAHLGQGKTNSWTWLDGKLMPYAPVGLGSHATRVGAKQALPHFACTSVATLIHLLFFPKEENFLEGVASALHSTWTV
jgi:hypothetical protein